MKNLKLNTSNLGKFEEFKRLFARLDINIEATHFDLKEIDSDPISVVTHKASQLEEDVLIEDTSLEIEGASVGVNVRWLLDHLSEYKGRKANWTVLLAYHKEGKVFIYKGNILGTIVEPQGIEGFGFDPIFLPDGAVETLAQSKPDLFNARAQVVESLKQGHVWLIRPIIKKWDGPWQQED